MCLKTAIVFLLSAASLVVGPAALAEDHTISNACSQLKNGYSAEYTLAIPTEHKSATVRIADSSSSYHDAFNKKFDGSWRAGRLVRDPILPLVLRAAFAGNSNGQVVLFLRTWAKGKTNSWQFSSIGTAESLYALRCLSPEPTWAKDFTKSIPTSLLVVPMSSAKSTEIFTAANKLPEPDVDSALLSTAKVGFDVHRAEIFSRFSHSMLFYTRAQDLRWSLCESGGEFYARSRCDDSMNSAYFAVELRRNDDRHWDVIQIYAGEWFRGE